MNIVDKIKLRWHQRKERIQNEDLINECTRVRKECLTYYESELKKRSADHKIEKIAALDEQKELYEIKLKDKEKFYENSIALIKKKYLEVKERNEIMQEEYKNLEIGIDKYNRASSRLSEFFLEAQNEFNKTFSIPFQKVALLEDAGLELKKMIKGFKFKEINKDETLLIETEEE